MKLMDIEPGQHSPHDWNKRLGGSYVYGYCEGHSNKPSTILISEITALDGCSPSAYSEAYLVVKAKTNSFSARLSELHIESFRPDPGVYNLDVYPIILTHTSFRQWHFGCTSESIRINRLNKGPNYVLNFQTLDACFNPWYPTIPEAVKLLKTRKRKHIALSNKVSLLASGVKLDRFALLYKMVPIATINNGLWFNSVAGKHLEKVSNEYKACLLELI